MSSPPGDRGEWTGNGGGAEGAEGSGGRAGGVIQDRAHGGGTRGRLGGLGADEWEPGRGGLGLGDRVWGAAGGGVWGTGLQREEGRSLMHKSFCSRTRVH
jgi:hypothetical protein